MGIVIWVVAMTRRATNSNRRNFLKLTGTGVAGMMVAGCIDGENGGDGSPDTLVYTSSTEIPSTDPAAISGHADLSVNYNAYDPLVTVDEDLTIVGRLATDWESADGGQRWTFQIREGVKTHAGNTLTAEDVVYTVERAKEVGTGISSLWSTVTENVEATGEQEVEFTLDEPFGPFVATLSTCFVVDKTALEGAAGDYGTEHLESNSAGTGPYTLEERNAGNQATFDRFDDYFQGWDENSIDRVRMEIIPEESTNRQMMTTGEAHITDQYLSPQGYEEIGNSDVARVYEDSQPSLYHMMMNTRKEPFDDVNVRKAFNLAFDAQSAVDDIWGGGTVAAGPVPVGVPGKNEDLEPYDTDSDAATEAIEQSGYSVDDINAIDITIAHPTGFTNQRRNALLLQNNLSDIGVDINVSAEQWSSITNRVTDSETAPRILSSTASASVPTADAHTYQMHHPSQLGTYTSASWYSTDELTQVLEDARTESDQETRYDLYREAQQLIAEGYPSVYVCYIPFRVGLNEQVGGFKDLKLMGASHQFHNYNWE